MNTTAIENFISLPCTSGNDYFVFVGARWIFQIVLCIVFLKVY